MIGMNEVSTYSNLTNFWSFQQAFTVKVMLATYFVMMESQANIWSTVSTYRKTFLVESIPVTKIIMNRWMT